MAETWRGGAELLIYRDNACIPVRLILYRKPERPGMAGRWAGTFVGEPFTILTLGRGMITLPDGAEAEVLVEGFDVVTGAGDFIGIDAAPF